LWGATKWVILGFLGRSGRPDEIFWEPEPAGVGRSFERRPSPIRSAAGITPPATDGQAASRRDESREERQSLERRERREPRGEEQARGNRRRRRRRGGRGSNPSGGGSSSSSSPTSNPPPSKPDTPSDSTET